MTCWIHHRFCLGLLLAGSLWMASAAYAQPTHVSDTTITSVDVRPLAHFEEATALAVDPTGRLYVTDAGADVVVQLAADGTVQERAGGPGTEPGTFDDPTDVDPTNGLAIFVADAGNARIQRFARSFRFLEAIPVGNGSDPPARSTYDREASGVFMSGTGRPVAVASSAADELYVIDAARGHVVQWDPRRRSQRAIGAFNAGTGALREPVALALEGGERLYVADRGRNAVLVYDGFGSFLRAVAEGQAADVQGLFIADGMLWLVCAGRVLVFDRQGRLERRWTVHVDAPLVDGARYRGTTYLLTAGTLYRVIDMSNEEREE